MKSKQSGWTKQDQEDIDWSRSFDWSLTQFFQHLVDYSDWPAAQAVAEIKRAIDNAEVPYRVFEEVNGRLVSKEAGNADFFRTGVSLWLSHQDAAEPEVQAQPSGGIGWHSRNCVWRVPSRIVKGRYGPRPKPALGYGNKSRTQQQILLFTDEEFRDGWEHIGTGVLMDRVAERFKKAGLTVPDRSTFNRAYDRD